MALRRMLPMAKIDYIRVPGVEWIEDPHERFQSIEIRKSLVLALPQAEASVIDELPRGFHLPDDSPYSVQEPIVPRKVVREAIANAVMHRTYLKHSPIQIIRYSNRIEFRNIGHSIKPEDQLGRPGSWPRNPLLGAVLHDLNLAEAKGSGIRTMRRLSADADLSSPEFKSDREGDNFCVTVFLHNLLSEDDHAWLRTLTSEPLDDEETKVLIYARATGAVDNSACRDFSGMDTLTASRVLRRLRDRGLLEKHGGGNRTYYSLRPSIKKVVEAAEANTHSDSTEVATLLATLPPELATQLATFGKRVDSKALRNAVLQLCEWQPMSIDQLATLLGRDRNYLRNKHLADMIKNGDLEFLYPESINHPYQAYKSARSTGK